MLRLFVALDLPGEIRDRLVMLQAGVPGARWIKSDNLHVTLRFIGEVDDPVAQDLDAALSRVVAPQFAIQLDGVGHFGTERKPQVLWAGVTRSEALQFVRDKVDRAVVAAGLNPDERKFRPHVTLGRLKNAPADRVARWLAGNALFLAGPITVLGFGLYLSHLHSEGAIYEELAQYPLNGSLNGR